MNGKSIDTGAAAQTMRMQVSSNHRWYALRRVLEKYAFVAPAVVILVTLLVYPLLYTAQMSFSSFDSARFTTGNFVGLRNYESILNNRGFWTSLRVTAVYLVTALPLQLALGTIIALALAVEWRGVRVVRALFIIPMVITSVVAGTVWKILLDPLWGFMNYLASLVGMGPISWFGDPILAMISIVLIDTWHWTPFVALVIMAGVVSLDREPFEAAQVDGASALQRFFHVTLPMLTPVIMAAFVVRWLGAIKIFDLVLTATQGGPGSSTEVINLFIYELTFRRLTFDRSAAAIVLVGIISLFLTFILMRFSNSREQ